MNREQVMSQFPGAIERLHADETYEDLFTDYKEVYVDVRGILIALAYPNDYSLEWRPDLGARWFFLGEGELATSGEHPHGAPNAGVRP